MKKVVNQDSGCSIDVYFWDDNKNPVVPASVSYKVTDVNSLTELISDTAIDGGSLDTMVTIEVDPSTNALKEQTQESEPKVLTITYSYWNGIRTVIRTDEFQYNVVRLYGKITEDTAL